MRIYVKKNTNCHETKFAGRKGKAIGYEFFTNYFLLSVSTFNNLCRILTYRAPYAATYREGDEQDDGKEDTHIYPPGDRSLLYILRHPLLHDDVAYGKSYSRGGNHDKDKEYGRLFEIYLFRIVAIFVCPRLAILAVPHE